MGDLELPVLYVASLQRHIKSDRGEKILNIHSFQLARILRLGESIQVSLTNTSPR